MFGDTDPVINLANQPIRKICIYRFYPPNGLLNYQELLHNNPSFYSFWVEYNNMMRAYGFARGRVDLEVGFEYALQNLDSSINSKYNSPILTYRKAIEFILHDLYHFILALIGLIPFDHATEIEDLTDEDLGRDHDIGSLADKAVESFILSPFKFTRALELLKNEYRQLYKNLQFFHKLKSGEERRAKIRKQLSDSINNTPQLLGLLVRTRKQLYIESDLESSIRKALLYIENKANLDISFVPTKVQVKYSKLNDPDWFRQLIELCYQLLKSPPDELANDMLAIKHYSARNAKLLYGLSYHEIAAYLMLSE